MSLSRKIWNKKTNASQEGIGFFLSSDEVVKLLDAAGITETDWKHDGWHLARFNDSGDYTFSNCRFIPAAENYREKKISDASREAARRNVKAAFASPVRVENYRKAVADGRVGVSASRLPVNKLSPLDLEARYLLVSHLDHTKRGYRVQASKILNTTPQHVGRMVKKWIELGIIHGDKR